MESPLSLNEREALSRFVSKLIEDVDRLATLFESRGADSVAPRIAQAQLQTTLKSLNRAEDLDATQIQALVPGRF